MFTNFVKFFKVSYEHVFKNLRSLPIIKNLQFTRVSKFLRHLWYHKRRKVRLKAVFEQLIDLFNFCEYLDFILKQKSTKSGPQNGNGYGIELYFFFFS